MPAPDRRLARLLAAVLFLYYLLTLGGHHYSIDGIVMFQSAKQVFFRHSFVLDPPVRWGPDVIRENPFSVGFTLAYLPALALASPLFYVIPSLQRTPYDPARPRNPELYGNLAYLLCAWLNPLITALTGALVFLIARRLGLPRRWAVLTTLAYGVASPAAAYARYDFSQPLAALALTAAVYGLLPRSARASPGRDERGGVWGAISGPPMWLVVLLLTRPELGVVIAWIGAWLVIDARRVGARAVALRVAGVAVSVLLALGLCLAANQARFGDWTRTGHASLSWLFAFSGPRLLEGALGLLLSPSHGILIFHPLGWLALPGLYRLVKDRHPAGLLWSGLVLSSLAFYAFYKGWWAGWSWGPRFLVPLLPLLTVAAAAWTFAAARRGGRWPTPCFWALAAAGVVVACNGILLDFVLYYRWLEKTGPVPDSVASQFALGASPLVSGWRFLATARVDLLLLRMGEFGGVLGTASAVLIASTLLGALAWSARALWTSLRDDPGDDGSITSATTPRR